MSATRKVRMDHKPSFAAKGDAMPKQGLSPHSPIAETVPHRRRALGLHASGLASRRSHSAVLCIAPLSLLVVMKVACPEAMLSSPPKCSRPTPCICPRFRRASLVMCVPPITCAPMPSPWGEAPFRWAAKRQQSPRASRLTRFDTSNGRMVLHTGQMHLFRTHLELRPTTGNSGSFNKARSMQHGCVDMQVHSTPQHGRVGKKSRVWSSEHFQMAWYAR